MYFNAELIADSFRQLEEVHTFFMVTFLVCKREELVVGKMASFDIAKLEKEFLETYFRPTRASERYLRISQVNAKQRWLRLDYPSKGSQKYRTEGRGANAFLHELNTDLWGWKDNYVQSLKSILKKGHQISAFALAVWLYREHNWAQPSPDSVLEKLVDEFHLSNDEIDKLFDMSVPPGASEMFQSIPVEWATIQRILELPPPPDLPAATGGFLKHLKLVGIGPSNELQIELADRVNLITGDNGLGKTFLLECAWWVLTGEWTGLPIVPRHNAEEPSITYQLSSRSRDSRPRTVKYDWNSLDWPATNERETIPGLIIYARVDGAFAVWDPSRITRGPSGDSARALLFSREDIWDGLVEDFGYGQKRYLCNGLIEDWVYWQSIQDQRVFNVLRNVLKSLSPPEQGDLGILEPDEPVQIPGGGSKRIPTIRHPYANRIPLTQASAAVRRVAALAYLIVWVWEEHKIQSSHIKREPQRNMVILIDEIEAHLHPQWQRVILPALLDLQSSLAAEIEIQYIIATHAPLVLASLEPNYDPDIDTAFHLELVKKNLIEDTVILEKPDFLFGSVESWLRSDFFEIKHARSIEAEQAIEAAKRLQQQTDMSKVSEEEVRKVSEKLESLLGAHDSFWPRWIFFAKRFGVEM